MNNLNLYVSFLAIFMIMACDNNRESGENKIVNEEAPQYEGGLDGNSNNLYGNDSAFDSDTIRADTILPGPIHIRIIAELPGKVAKEIQIDPKLKNLQLINNRSFEEEGNTYYELTFDDQTKVTFDQEGNRQGRPLETSFQQ